MSSVYDITEAKYQPLNAAYGMTSEFINVAPKVLPDLPVSKKWTIEPCFLPKRYEQFANDLHNFVVRPDDVWIIAYPKCGTTWAQEMVWLISNNLDYHTASQRLLTDRNLFLELEIIMDFNTSTLKDQIARANQSASPRYIKSHLPVGLLPHQVWTIKPKIIYVARNTKDAAVSYYHHYRHIQGYDGTFEEFMDIFLADQAIYSPFHSHVLNFWTMREEPNILFLTFEHMKRNLQRILEETVKLFNASYSSAELIVLENHLSFDIMSQNSAANMSNALDIIPEAERAKKENYK